MNKAKNILTVCLCGIILFGLFAWCIAKPSDKVSNSERRLLARAPSISLSTIKSGKFMSDFEKYTVDRFPLREFFRTIKSLVAFDVFLRKDNNDLYLEDSFIAKTEYPLTDGAIEKATNKFNAISKKYFDKSNNVFLSIIPDKNYFLAEKSGHLSYDYDSFVKQMKDGFKTARYIDIFNLLEIDDYYKTDTHWRREKIIPVAKKLANEMGADFNENFVEEIPDETFYGVYHGRISLPIDGEKMTILHSDAIDNSKVFDLETEKYVSIYNYDALSGNDLYETYLHGSKSLLKIENKNAKTDKELVVFRDSFGSSIAPLLVEGYKSITLVDIRYISSALLSNWIDFQNKDILFLYSTTVLNNSVIFK